MRSSSLPISQPTEGTVTKTANNNHNHGSLGISDTNLSNSKRLHFPIAIPIVAVALLGVTLTALSIWLITRDHESKTIRSLTSYYSNDAAHHVWERTALHLDEINEALTVFSSHFQTEKDEDLSVDFLYDHSFSLNNSAARAGGFVTIFMTMTLAQTITETTLLNQDGFYARYPTTDVNATKCFAQNVNNLAWYSTAPSTQQQQSLSSPSPPMCIEYTSGYHMYNVSLINTPSPFMQTTNTVVDSIPKWLQQHSLPFSTFLIVQELWGKESQSPVGYVAVTWKIQELWEYLVSEISPFVDGTFYAVVHNGKVVTTTLSCYNESDVFVPFERHSHNYIRLLKPLMPLHCPTHTKYEDYDLSGTMYDISIGETDAYNFTVIVAVPSGAFNYILDLGRAYAMAAWVGVTVGVLAMLMYVVYYFHHPLQSVIENLEKIGNFENPYKEGYDDVPESRAQEISNVQFAVLSMWIKLQRFAALLPEYLREEIQQRSDEGTAGLVVGECDVSNDGSLVNGASTDNSINNNNNSKIFSSHLFVQRHVAILAIKLQDVHTRCVEYDFTLTYSRAIEIIHRHTRKQGGVIVNTNGDSVTVSFNAVKPCLHKTSAACTAILRMNSELLQDDFVLHAGVSKGIAMCGELGSSRVKNYSVLGPVMPEAILLCSLNNSKYNTTTLVNGALYSDLFDDFKCTILDVLHFTKSISATNPHGRLIIMDVKNLLEENGEAPALATGVFHPLQLVDHSGDIGEQDMTTEVVSTPVMTGEFEPRQVEAPQTLPAPCESQMLHEYNKAALNVLLNENHEFVGSFVRKYSKMTPPPSDAPRGGNRDATPHKYVTQLLKLKNVINDKNIVPLSYNH